MAKMKIKKSDFLKLIRESAMNEGDAVIPAEVNKWMKKFIETVEEYNLNYRKKLTIFNQLIKSLGIDDKQMLNKFAMKAKKDM